MCLRAQEINTLKMMDKGMKMMDIVDMMQENGENLSVGPVMKLGNERLNLVTGTTRKSLGVARTDTAERNLRKRKQGIGVKGKGIHWENMAYATASSRGDTEPSEDNVERDVNEQQTGRYEILREDKEEQKRDYHMSKKDQEKRRRKN
jgi:hypothetical protein